MSKAVVHTDGFSYPKLSLSQRWIKDIRKNKYKYLMIIPVLAFFLIFHYKPMYGIIIAFKDFRPTRGIFNSPWVGFQHFINFFNDVYFTRVVRNTFSLSFLTVIFSFPAPILLALLLNELRSSKFKRITQTVTYMPYFISMVVICGLIRSYSMTDGLFNELIVLFGGTRTNLLNSNTLFYPIYVISEIWQKAGWESIIYLAALGSIDSSLYEAAQLDGANRFHQVRHVTLPGLMPTIIVMLILKMGGLLSVSADKILLLYQPLTYEVADVIGTYVYRKGIIEGSYSYSTAIGLFNSVINVTFLVITNMLSKKYSKYGLF